MSLLVDVHAHLSDTLLKKDVPKIIERAKKAGVKVIITNGLGPDNSEQLEIAKEYDIVKAALGFYPTNVQEASDEDIEKTIEFIKNNNPIALGEIGLDKKKLPSDKEWNKQVTVFKRLLSLAEKLKKPVIIHSRKAEREVIDILKDYKLCVIMHCFGGKMSLVKECIERGYYFSIPPILIKSTHFQAIVNLVDLSHLLTETDAPYMSPYKEKFNESAFVNVTIENIARIKGTTVDDTEKAIFKNYMDCFTE